MILSSQLIALGIEEGPVSIVECLSRLALICFGSMAALKWSMFPSPLVPVVVREKCSLNDAASNMSYFFLLLRMLLAGSRRHCCCRPMTRKTMATQRKARGGLRVLPQNSDSPNLRNSKHTLLVLTPPFSLHTIMPPSTVIHVGSHSRTYIWGCFLMTFSNNVRF